MQSTRDRVELLTKKVTNARRDSEDWRCWKVRTRDIYVTSRKLFLCASVKFFDVIPIENVRHVGSVANWLFRLSVVGETSVSRHRRSLSDKKDKSRGCAFDKKTSHLFAFYGIRDGIVWGGVETVSTRHPIRAGYDRHQPKQNTNWITSISNLWKQRKGKKTETKREPIRMNFKSIEMIYATMFFVCVCVCMTGGDSRR